MVIEIDAYPRPASRVTQHGRQVTMSPRVMGPRHEALPRPRGSRQLVRDRSRRAEGSQVSKQSHLSVTVAKQQDAIGALRHLSMIMQVVHRQLAPRPRIASPASDMSTRDRVTPALGQRPPAAETVPTAGRWENALDKETYTQATRCARESGEARSRPKGPGLLHADPADDVSTVLVGQSALAAPRARSARDTSRETAGGMVVLVTLHWVVVGEWEVGGCTDRGWVC